MEISRVSNKVTEADKTVATTKISFSTNSQYLLSQIPTAMGTESTVRNSTDANDPFKELEWVTVQVDSTDAVGFSRLKEKIMQNPLVPVGMLATAGILALGIRSFIMGNPKRSQLMMRWRVGMQLATICVLFAGVLYQENKNSKSH